MDVDMLKMKQKLRSDSRANTALLLHHVQAHPFSRLKETLFLAEMRSLTDL
jgi:hypothetical protein